MAQRIGKLFIATHESENLSVGAEKIQLKELRDRTYIEQRRVHYSAFPDKCGITPKAKGRLFEGLSC